MGNILYVVMPAYNEEANIEKTVSDWYKVLDGKDEQSRLVVADSGSTDRTHEILAGLMNEMPQLVVLENTLKLHGPKLIALYKYAIEKKADYIFQTDSDGQTNSLEFEAFWNEREKYEAVFGFRRKRGDGASRMFVEKVLCMILRIIFKTEVPDANAPFRLMRADVLGEYMDRFQPDYNLPNVMIVTFFKHYGRNILFKEITFEDRRGGKNSINIRKICSIGLKSLKEFNQFRRNMK